jgi:hypothetical protein
MDATLAGLKWKSLLVYMDDIIIFSSTFDEHFKDLDEVFTRLDNANITLDFNKCEFFKEKIHYLDHVVSVEGIQPSQDKVQAILNKSSPSNIKELQNWLGISSYYSAFIPNFAKLCAPLYGLLRRDTETKMNFTFVVILIISSFVNANGQACMVNQKSSCASQPGFRFTIYNDVTDPFINNNVKDPSQLWWSDFTGKLVFYGNIPYGRTISILSGFKNLWFVTSASGIIRTFTCGQAPFSVSGQTIKITQIPTL